VAVEDALEEATMTLLEGRKVEFAQILKGARAQA
jgi:hypothetical protein